MDIQIKVPLKKLIEIGLNSEEFCILVLLYKKEFELLNQYQQKFIYFDLFMYKTLCKKGFILTTPKLIDEGARGEDLSLDRIACQKLFGIDGGDENFYKFFATFPQKVPGRGGGYRPLRPGDVDSQSAKKLKAKYFTKVGKKQEKQERVQKILEADIDMRKRTRTLQYMNAMEAYLNGFKWEDSAYLLETKEQKHKDNGGTKRGEQLI